MSNYPKSLEGQSCASCQYLIPVFCHPCNKEIGKGKVSQQLGFVCTLFQEDSNASIFLKVNTGICECHTLRDPF
jgi:hypothetical protein